MLKNDFVEKMQNAFKKKFGGDENENSKASKTLKLDFNFGSGNNTINTQGEKQTNTAGKGGGSKDNRSISVMQEMQPSV